MSFSVQITALMLSVIFFPDHELTEGERRVKHVGNGLVYTGTILIVVSALEIWFSM